MNLFLLGSFLISLFLLGIYVALAWLVFCLLYVGYLCLKAI